MSKIKACEPESSKAARIEATTFSALASAPSAISPLILTRAVCGFEMLVEVWLCENTCHSTTNQNNNQPSLKPTFHLREACCSFKLD